MKNKIVLGLWFCVLFVNFLVSSAESSNDSSASTSGLDPTATPGVTSERCEAVPETGPCRAYFVRWYYDIQTNRCENFTYGGCKGNMNNYKTEEDCKSTCSIKVQARKAPKNSMDSTQYKEYCEVAPEPGHCRAAFFMFYHDSKTGTCKEFIYGGCGGNNNRYSTMVECETRCSNADSSAHGHEKTRNRWTVALFLFVTLAGLSALLLVVLIIISLRRHRLTRHPSTMSDKEELLPEEKSPSTRKSPNGTHA
ncbi:kunitz-type protease inhibitor 2 isoform X2 [Thalassophryne amazonica]|uniref:kunitz-type protease inhibitor 2 isoform X2 n=1 Tax=Thalassophryne amazonica TaxID=390379 RepID=UPI001471DE54|nr:kunitz-type protease inhibitor 2 isoform X2 [Thalassophryne amazonica]